MLVGTNWHLLEHGTNINEHYLNDDTLLHHACINSCKQLVRLCLQHGADVAVGSGGPGKTALHMCSIANTARLLLDHSADISAQDCGGLIMLVILVPLVNFHQVLGARGDNKHGGLCTTI